MEGGKCLISDFKSDGLQKKDRHRLFGPKMRQFKLRIA